MKFINFLFTLVVFCFLNTELSAQSKSKKSASPSSLVYPHLDSANSRWFFFSSASRPFGMVNLSPDTEINGAWGSGYRYNTTNIKGFSHIHAWQLSGPSIMPVSFDLKDKKNVLEDFSSDFSHDTEIVQPGYHQLILDKYNITVALTSTTRVGFHKYQFSNNAQKAILLNLKGKLGPCKITDAKVTQISKTIFKGSITNAPTHRRPKPTKVYFYLTTDKPIESLENNEGQFMLNLPTNTKQIQLKMALSYTSTENAKNNLEQELPHWNFDRIKQESTQQWDQLLSRIKVKGGSHQAQRRFYTDLWHALQGRRIISDVNGHYPDFTKDTFRIGKIPLNDKGQPKFNHYNSDSFWGAQWTISTLWQLVYPEIAEDFVQSLLQYGKDGGLIPRGPSGGNYTYVMTGSSATPFLVGAYQKGLRNYDVNQLYQLLLKNHSANGIMNKAGYEHKTTLGGGFEDYEKNGYVPYPNPNGRFGGHQDGASLTLEYAFQDYALAQLARTLGKTQDYKYFLTRSKNYKNVYDKNSGWMRPKNQNGQWKTPFDPYQHQHGFVEANAAQATWFVPHDLKGLAKLMGGKQKAIQKLEQQFKTASTLNFTAGNKHAQETDPKYRRVPINYGNQPSMQTAHVFHELGRPDLTEKWVHKIIDKVYSGLNPETGYNGDEDQGLMGSLAVLLKIGLFQMTSGVEAQSHYLLTAPIFDEITLSLNPKYYQGKEIIILNQKKNQKESMQKASFNQKKLNNFKISHQQLTEGGTIIFN